MFKKEAAVIGAIGARIIPVIFSLARLSPALPPKHWCSLVPRSIASLEQRGNGSTLRGIGETLRQDKQAIKLFAFDPAAALVAYRLKYGDVPSHTPHAHQVFGAGAWDIDFPHLTHAIQHLMDDVLIVEDKDWHEAQRRLQEQGYDVGPTSAASYHLACQYCSQHANQKVLIVFYDSADHY